MRKVNNSFWVYMGLNLPGSDRRRYLVSAALYIGCRPEEIKGMLAREDGEIERTVELAEHCGFTEKDLIYADNEN